MVVWSAWANITQENYLYSTGKQSRNNFAQENNLQFCLDLSQPSFLNEITCGILAREEELRPNL